MGLRVKVLMTNSHLEKLDRFVFKSLRNIYMMAQLLGDYVSQSKWASESCIDYPRSSSTGEPDGKIPSPGLHDSKMKVGAQRLSSVRQLIDVAELVLHVVCCCFATRQLDFFFL